VVYDTNTNKASLLFDKPLWVPTTPHLTTCIFEDADLSPTRSTLYIVIPCYATCGCLAIIDLPTGRVRYVPGVMDVFVVRGGPNARDLIYSKRLLSKPTKYDSGHPRTTRTFTLGLTARESPLFQTRISFWSGETRRLRFCEPTCEASTVASLCKASGFLKAARICHVATALLRRGAYPFAGTPLVGRSADRENNLY
jgi:hypothetical protein